MGIRAMEKQPFDPRVVHALDQLANEGPGAARKLERVQEICRQLLAMRVPWGRREGELHDALDNARMLLGDDVAPFLHRVATSLRQDAGERAAAFASR